MENKVYRTKLTDPEYNALLKLTSHLKVDSIFDVYDCGEQDCFRDWEEDRMVDLKTGLDWLFDSMVYPLSHDGMSAEEAHCIINLLLEFDIMTPELAPYYL